MSEPEPRTEVESGFAMPADPGGTFEHPIAVVERRGVDQQFLKFYGLIEQPFGVTPDLRFLYLGAKHRKALDELNYSTELNRGFLTLIAKPGMGKTSLLFQYLEDLRDKARTVFLFQTDCDATELMRYLLAELGLDGKGMDLPEMRAVLNRILLGEMEAGRRFVLIIDEAQNLDEKVLESIRLLSNFETPWMKLVHIVLAGQPQLAERLAKPSMDQLRQRVSLGIRIEPFTREEVDLYIDHRLWVAGYKGSPLFSLGARSLIAERSKGIPRIINNLCFCAMSQAWAMKNKTVDRDTIIKVLADFDPESPVEKIGKEAFGPILIEEPKTRVSYRPQPASLTLKSPPAWGVFSMFAVVCIVGLVLGWFAFQPSVDQRVGSYFNTLLAGVKSFVPPTAAQGPPGPASTVVPDQSSSSPRLEGTSDATDIKVPQQGDVESPPSGGGHD